VVLVSSQRSIFTVDIAKYGCTRTTLRRLHFVHIKGTYVWAYQRTDHISISDERRPTCFHSQVRFGFL
jgi:hypothetical protein